MSYQKYNLKAKTVFFDVKLQKTVSIKTESTITFRSLLEYKVYNLLCTLLGCEIKCQIPIKGETLLWVVDFVVIPKGNIGKDVLNKFRELMGLSPGRNLYIEAKGVITKEFSEKLRLCSVECPNVYKNLLGFGDTPLGVVVEDGFKVSCFPIRSTKLLKEAILYCNNAAVRRI